MPASKQSLRASEAKYRSLFTSIDEGFNLLEMIPDESGHPIDFRIVETNPAWEQQTGLTDATGKTLLEIAPNFEQHWLDFYSDVLISGRGRRTEYYTAAVNRWFTVFASRIGGEGSRQVAVVFNDITERKRSEIQLRRAAERDAFRLKLSDALRSLTDPVQIQAEACRLLGEQLGADRAYYVEVHEPEGYARVNQHYSRGGSPAIVGNYRLSEYGWSLPLMRRGETIVITDTQSTDIIPDVERAAMARIGMIGFVAIPLIKGEVLVGSLAVNEPTPREWTEAEVDLVRETAERIWADIQRAHAETALRDSELQRIREQAAREEERQRAESLAELDRAKTLFFSNVSHEFRTPLTLSLAPLQDALKTVDEWMSNGVDENPSTHRPIDPSTLKPNLELVHRNSLRLLKLVNTLLDFSRIEAGRMEAVYEPTDLATYTAELSSVFRSAIERAGLQLIVDCPPLPEPVFVDREMWEKIVLNLLSNAFKFTLQGEITVSLRVESRSDLQASTSTLQASTSAPHDSTLDPQSSTSKLDPATSELETLTSTVEISSTEHDPSTSNLRVILQIRDTGAGIAPEHLPHLFERFYQIRETQARTHEGLGIGLALVHELVDLGIAADFLPRVFDRFSQAGANAAKGLGLGLATGHRYPQPCGIARHIVELHHGTIHAHSAGGGQGATFTVTLPLLQNGEG